MRARVLGAVAPFVCFLVFAAAPSRAEPPPLPLPAPLPVPGFLPPYEVTRIARSAGFDPLAPPLREGTTYVLRATDFRGILMRVVVDGHSGAIRAVNRIVAATDYAVGMIPPYGAPPYGPPPYGVPVYRGPPIGEPYATLPPEAPPGYDGPEIAPAETSAPPPAAPPVHTVTRPGLRTLPPLPRPRPASLVSRKAPDDAAAGVKSGDKSEPAPAAVAAKPDAPNLAPAGPATANKPRAAEPLND